MHGVMAFLYTIYYMIICVNLDVLIISITIIETTICYHGSL